MSGWGIVALVVSGGVTVATVLLATFYLGVATGMARAHEIVRGALGNESRERT